MSTFFLTLFMSFVTLVLFAAPIANVLGFFNRLYEEMNK